MRSLVMLLALFTPSVAWADNDFKPLFNGKNLDGWQARGGGKLESWSVQDGILTAKAGTGWLGTKEMFGNYVLRVEWKIPTNGNSGVFLRVPDVETNVSPSQTAMEIQILDDAGPVYVKQNLKLYQYSGSLYGFVAPSKAVYKEGAWNTYEITCNGDHVTIVFNNEKIVDADFAKHPELLKRPKRGFVGLQNHGSAVEFRKVEIKVLEK